VATLNSVLLRKFLRTTLIPVIVVELLLIVAIFSLNSYQAEQNKKVLSTLAQSSFGEIAHQISARLEAIFTLSKNNIEQIRTHAQEIFTHPSRYSNRELKLFYNQGFFQNRVENGLSSVYTTNISSLNEKDREVLENLSLLVPIVEKVVQSNRELIYSSWINIDKYYSLFYPYVKTVEDLSPNLDVTRQKFYYEADANHNPERKSLFIDLYNEPWAISFGQLGSILSPIYVNEKFLGVIGLTLSIKDSANILREVKLPFNGFVSLIDNKSRLLVSSDDQRMKKELGSHSFYWMHKQKIFKPLEDVRFSKEYKNENAVLEIPIKGTNLELIFIAKNSDINAEVNKIYENTKRIGYTIVVLLLLFYILYILFIVAKIKKLSFSIADPVKKMVTFSKSLGRGKNLTLENTGIEEINSLNENLLSTHKKLTQMLIKDDLTDLYNRRKLLMDIKPELAQSVMILNLGNLKSINTIYGSHVGDQALIRFSETLNSCKQEGNLFYRIGSSEFAVLSTAIADSKIHAEELENLLAEIAQTTIDYNGIDIALSATAGVAFSVPNEKSDLSLLARAGIALSQAKAHHRGSFVLFHDALIQKTEHKKNLEWGRKVKDALNEGRLVAYFQPIYNISQNRVYKFESLVRMVEGEEVISPFHFLQAAEQIGKLNEITRVMIKQVFSIASQFPNVEFSINTSFEDFEHADIMPFIKEQLDAYNVKASNIIFEILETGNVYDESIASNFINELKILGFKIAIDDFGTGNSNFAHLMMMNVDFIKIDGQFVKDINTNKNSELITKTIAGFAKLADAKTIAEYVADVHILKEIEKIGIDYAQGYYISAPQSGEKLQEMLNIRL